MQAKGSGRFRLNNLPEPREELSSESFRAGLYAIYAVSDTLIGRVGRDREKSTCIFVQIVIEWRIIGFSQFD